MTTVNDDHFDGGANLSKGTQQGTDTILADHLETLYVADTALAARTLALESIMSNLDPKASVKLCTAGALNAYTASGSKVGKKLTQNAAAVENIDGVAVVVGDRILVNDDGTATGADRGIYTVTTVGTVAVAQVLTRATDADTNAEVTSGMFCRVTAGSTLAGTGFYLATADPINLDVTALSFNPYDKYAAAGEIANVTKAAAAAGTAKSVARGDHKHDVTTAAPAATGVATAAAEGAATSLARSDHAHLSNTAPSDVTKAAAVIGASGEPARADHKHDVSCAAPAALSVAPNNVATEGVATSLSRSDHLHPLTFPLIKAFLPRDGTPAAAVTAALATRNARNVVAFDDTLEESFHFEGIMPAHLSIAGDLTVRIFFAMDADNNVAHNLTWGVSFEKIEEGNLDIDGDGFAAEIDSAAVACPAVAGYVTHADVVLTRAQADAIAPGENFRINVHRDVAAGGGSTGDAHVVGVHIYQ